MHIRIGNDESLKKAYIECNKKYFKNELPLDVKVEWSSRMTRTAGNCSGTTNKKTKKINHTIKLSTHYHMKFNDEIIDTLVHEMIHVKYPKEHHGELFQREMRRINREFGFNIQIYAKEAALIRYSYICKDCGYTHQRTNRIHEYWRCRCGMCDGNLNEVTL